MTLPKIELKLRQKTTRTEMMYSGDRMGAFFAIGILYFVTGKWTKYTSSQ